jgi:hypothetical protein
MGLLLNSCQSDCELVYISCNILCHQKFFCEYGTISTNKYELSQTCCMAQGQQMKMHNQVLNLVFEIVVAPKNYEST